MDIPTNELAERIGHDGSFAVDLNVPDPGGRLGHHPQEIIDVAIDLGWTVTPYQRIPVSRVAEQNIQVADRWDRFTDLVSKTRGVMFGHGHAVAYDNGLIYEPDCGDVYEFSFRACEARNFFPTEIHIYDRKVHAACGNES